MRIANKVCAVGSLVLTIQHAMLACSQKSNEQTIASLQRPLNFKLTHYLRLELVH